MVEEWYQFFNLVHVVFERTLNFTKGAKLKEQDA